jgi:hypothetical protein
MMGGGSRTSGDNTGRTAPPSDNPLGQIFEEMLRGGTGGGKTGSADDEREMPDYEPEPEERRESGHNGGLEGMFGDMFETGRKVQKDYQRGIESIFDQYMDAMKKG